MNHINDMQKKVTKDKQKLPKEPNGTRLALLMQEAVSKNLFSFIEDPAAWQRKIRKDRPLPGRDD